MEHEQIIASIDIGSNSFHMLVASSDGQKVSLLDKLGEKVQLARGIKNSRLDAESMHRGWICLERFAQRLNDFSPDRIQVVGTNALRVAKNRQKFIDRAEQILNVPVEVISGREEARLIYLGVSHTLGDDSSKRLVIDIGGGSTELIIGEKFEAKVLESLHMGCVSYKERFFSDGVISESNIKKAYQYACVEISHIRKVYQKIGWQEVVGASGTLQAVEQVLIGLGLTETGISRKALVKLRKALLECKHADELNFVGLKESRRAVFASGVAIVLALFDTLDLEFMSISGGALREGVLYDTMGRLEHEDVRERSIANLEKTYKVNVQSGEQVAEYARYLYQSVRKDWQLDKVDASLLIWAGRLHEVGMQISHSSFHKHGEYILSNSDMDGFSRDLQRNLAVLVRSHRRKLSNNVFELLGKQRAKLEKLAIILRLSVIFKYAELPKLEIHAAKNKLCLCFPDGWLADHPLTQAELEHEQVYLQKIDYTLELG